MIAGEEARWVRSEPRRELAAAMLERIVQAAFPRRRAVAIEPLAGGLRNSNFKLHLDSAPHVAVLRIYEHDASLCRKEIDLMRLVGGSVPVPEVLHAEPLGFEDVPPFILMRYVEGVSFLQLKRAGDQEAIAQAAFSAGEVLAGIGRFTFPRAGWLAPGPLVTWPLLEGADPAPRFADLCLASPNFARRALAELRDRVHALMWSWAGPCARLTEETCLVHGDFNRRNLLVRSVAGRWSVAAVVDWEFAVSGSPMADCGNFLRYERASQPWAEPHFSTGFVQAGGVLPPDWRGLARVIDLTAVCESLTHSHLSETVVAELIEILRCVVEDLRP